MTLRTSSCVRRSYRRASSRAGRHRYRIDACGIPLFAEQFRSAEALIQQQHYDKIAGAYAENLEYAHTIAYMEYLDDELRDLIAAGLTAVAPSLAIHYQP